MMQGASGKCCQSIKEAKELISLLFVFVWCSWTVLTVVSLRQPLLSQNSHCVNLFHGHSDYRIITWNHLTLLTRSKSVRHILMYKFWHCNSNIPLGSTVVKCSFNVCRLAGSNDQIKTNTFFPNIRTCLSHHWSFGVQFMTVFEEKLDPGRNNSSPLILPSSPFIPLNNSQKRGRRCKVNGDFF